MRCWLGAAALLTAGSITATADEARTVPMQGAKLTYRLVSITKTPDKTIGSGEVYTYIVTSSDGTTAEGRIRPEAKILYCAEGPDELACKDPAKTPGASFDGKLLTVPISSESAESLAAHGSFKAVHFLMVSRKFPMPSSRDPKEHDLSDFGPEPAFIVTNTAQCDLAGLTGFLPFGKSPQVSLPCEEIFELSASRDGRPPLSTHDSVTMEIADKGSGWVTLPSGNWQVRKLASKIVPKEPGHRASTSDVLFSIQLGVAVSNRTIVTNPARHSTTENTIELISVAP